MKPPVAADDVTAFRLVTRVFLRRLLDNDIISPHADRHQSLAVLYALVTTLAVFVTFFLSTPYLAAFIQLPGPAVLSALSDRFLFIAASLCIGALGALMVWDALALEARDAAILGPLPISARTISRAKLAAVTMFGAVLTVALNAVPTVLYPIFLTLNIRGTRGSTLLRLIAGHATTVTMAGLFGFFGIVAVRGLCRLLLGEQGFQRVSNSLQSALVVCVIAGLLLAPTVRPTDVSGWVGHTALPRWPARPVLWYLGVNETLAGHLLAENPVVLPPRFSGIAFSMKEDLAARAAYRLLQSPFEALARRAWLSLSLAAMLALATFLWTNRRLPDRAAGVPGRSRIQSSVRRMAERYTRDDPEAQAGFFFTLQTLTRSGPHRTILATAAAVGLSHALIVLAQGPRRSVEIQTTPLGVFGISNMLLLSLLAGVAYAVTVPAAPAASWAIRMAWRGDERGYLAGVKRAVMVLVATLLVVLLPLHVVLLAPATAVVRALVNVLFATAVLDALLLSYRKVPFACSYVPIENPKLVWPVAFVSLLAATYGLADVERWALQTTTGAIALGVTLGAIAILIRTIDRTRRRQRRSINFDARPALATQRLGLSEHITMQE